ncbi:MAG: DsbA family protein [Bdellovibrionota bacterium]|jgi:protein-disulfide isomerase
MKSRLFSSVLLSAALIVPSMASAETDAEFATKIEKYLQTEKGQEAVGKAIEAYAKAAEERARKEQEERQARQFEESFKNPTKIDIGKSPVKGPEDAKITIVEFSDFQCPYCSRGKNNMETVMKMYPNDVKLVFKQLPLGFHPQATPAAKASLAAGKQGKFWEMHDKLFDNQGKLSPEFYEEVAKELKLDIEKFKTDMESEEIAQQIKDETAEAAKYGISGTPGFFVNGVAVKGAYPPEHFKMIIDRWLSMK